ncbi:MAG TPA: hypothetical protein P5096_03385 [Patescibacteria group bacterium]|nr:hypothetical protein [Patescibacteria group bacterium]
MPTFTLKKKVNDFSQVVNLFTKEEISQLPREAVVKPRKKKDKVPRIFVEQEIAKLIPETNKVGDLGSLEKLFTPTEIKELGPPVVKVKCSDAVEDEIPEGDFSDIEEALLRGTQAHAFEMEPVIPSVPAETIPVVVTKNSVAEEIAVVTEEISVEQHEDDSVPETALLITEPEVQIVTKPEEVVKPNSGLVIDMLPEKRNTILAWNPEKPICNCGCPVFQGGLCKHHWRLLVREKKAK